MKKALSAALSALLLASCGSPPPTTPDFDFSGRWKGVADPGAFYTHALTLNLVKNGSSITGTFDITSYLGGTEEYHGTLTGTTSADTLQFKGTISEVPTGISFVTGCTFQASGFGETRNDTMQLKVIFDPSTCALPGGYVPPNWAAAFLLRS